MKTELFAPKKNQLLLILGSVSLIANIEDIK